MGGKGGAFVEFNIQCSTETVDQNRLDCKSKS